MKFTNVLIGIQARSTSERLPGKCFAMIGNKRLLDHVISACKSAASYTNRFSDKSGVVVRVALLIPEGDPIEYDFQGVHIIKGDEHDVLSRYVKAAKEMAADYIVRVTGDCPLIPPYMISKHISVALVNEYDYVCNCDENRTTLDGVDCEVISRRLLDFADKHAVSTPDREHVTALARREPPEFAKMGVSIGFFDLSDIKLSVDTEEDLERVRRAYEERLRKVQAAEKKYGKQFVHHI